MTHHDPEQPLELIHKGIFIAPLEFYGGAYLALQSRASAEAEASMTAGQAVRKRWRLFVGLGVFWPAVIVGWFHYMHQHGVYPSF